MKTSVHERVMSLVRLAVSATANENEAHVAATLVCQTILRHPTLLNPERLEEPSGSLLSDNLISPAATITSPHRDGRA